MIDIHAHILPAIDDGPTTLTQSVNIVKQAHAEGITAIFATSHSMNGVYQTTPTKIIKSCSQLTRELKNHNIPVHIRPGSEIRLTHDTVSQYDKGHLMTLNNLGRHILLELPPMFILDGVIHIIRQLAERGIVTIIAHPERNAAIKKNPDIISDLVDEGALMQITAMSVMGCFGKCSLKICKSMIENDTVTFVSSDIHPGRKFMMRDAYQSISRIAGSQIAERIFTKNPEEIMYFTPQVMNYAN